MPMVSMKRDAKPESESSCASRGADELYPYGLNIRLCDEDLKKLGITIDSLAVGQKLTITANAEVVSLSARKEQDETDAEAGLQITDLDLGLSASGSRLQALYSKSNMNP